MWMVLKRLDEGLTSDTGWQIVGLWGTEEEATKNAKRDVAEDGFWKRAEVRVVMFTKANVFTWKREVFR